MLKAKKLNIGSMLTVVMGVVMAIMITFTATNAWFADELEGTGYLGTSDAVALSFSAGADNDSALLDFDEEITRNLLPSQPVDFNIRAEVDQSNTEYLIRARFELLIDNGEAPPTYVDPNGEELTGVEATFYEWLALDGGIAGTNGWHELDGWFYQGLNGSAFEAELADEDAVEYTILSGTKVVPVEWTNNQAGHDYIIRLSVQAVQSTIWEDGATVADGPISLTQDTVPQIFDHVFGPTSGQPIVIEEPEVM